MRLININNLEEGMQIGQDLYDEYNRLLLGRGATLKGNYVKRLKDMGLPALYIQDADTSDISVPEMIPPAARAKAIQNLTNTFPSACHYFTNGSDTPCIWARIDSRVIFDSGCAHLNQVVAAS